MKKILISFLLCGLYMIFNSPATIYADQVSQRIAGNDRYQTAIEIAEKGWPDKSNFVILATGQNFADALCAAPLSQKYDCPILLNGKEHLLPSVKQEIERLGAKHALIIGGNGAISANVENALKAMNIQCTRISGQDRFETSVKIAEELEFKGELCVATGSNFPDAISISAIATQKEMPILLTAANNCPQSVRDYLKNKTVRATYVIGSSDVVNDTVANYFPQVKRLQGKDRYETNLAVIRNFSPDLNFNAVYVATGSNYPDALAASALAARTKSPVFLVSDTVVDQVKEYLLQNELTPDVLAIGQSDVVSDGILRELLQSKGNGNSSLQSVNLGDANFYDSLSGMVGFRPRQGLAANQGCWDYYYFENGARQPGKLYRIKTDGTQSLLLDTDKKENGSDNYTGKANINVLGEWIYYEAASSKLSGEDEVYFTKGIYRLKTDGSQKQQICADYVRDMVVQGNWIYYCNDSDGGRLYRIRTDGSERTKLSDDLKCYALNLQGNSIYYLLDHSEPEAGMLYRINTDGTNKAQVTCPDKICYMVVDEDRIFYLKYAENPIAKNEIDNENIYSMQMDGTERTLLNSVNNLDYGMGFAVTYGQIISKDAFHNLCRISANGKKQNFKVSPSDYWLVDSRIYYTQYNQDTGDMDLYRINIDGRNQVLLNSY